MRCVAHICMNYSKMDEPMRVKSTNPCQLSNSSAVRWMRASCDQSGGGGINVLSICRHARRRAPARTHGCKRWWNATSRRCHRRTGLCWSSTPPCLCPGTPAKHVRNRKVQQKLELISRTTWTFFFFWYFSNHSEKFGAILRFLRSPWRSKCAEGTRRSSKKCGSLTPWPHISPRSLRCGAKWNTPALWSAEKSKKWQKLREGGHAKNFIKRTEGGGGYY